MRIRLEIDKNRLDLLLQIVTSSLNQARKM